MNYYKLGSMAGVSVSGPLSSVRRAAKRVRKVTTKVSPAHILYNKVTKTRQGNRPAARSVARTRQAAAQGNPVARREMATMQAINADIAQREAEMGLPPPPPVPVDEMYPSYSDYSESDEYYEDEE
jgi:hypothetical protein